jgi:fructose/tagatose bisphosphate aldolase
LDRGAADETHRTPAEVEPSSAIAAAMAAMTEIVRERMREFGSAGQTP